VRAPSSLSFPLVRTEVCALFFFLFFWTLSSPSPRPLPFLLIFSLRNDSTAARRAAVLPSSTPLLPFFFFDRRVDKNFFFSFSVVPNSEAAEVIFFFLLMFARNVSLLLFFFFDESKALGFFPSVLAASPSATRASFPFFSLRHRGKNLLYIFFFFLLLFFCRFRKSDIQSKDRDFTHFRRFIFDENPPLSLFAERFFVSFFFLRCRRV